LPDTINGLAGGLAVLVLLLALLLLPLLLLLRRCLVADVIGLEVVVLLELAS